MKVIFMGTPEFAVPALKAIANSAHTLVAVYTKPPAKSGRGQKLVISPIHEIANNMNIPVYYPTSLKSPTIQHQIKELEADIVVVAAYGLILPQAVLDICPKGCLNIHPSLLPRWRGAAPIERTILAGDRETGVYVMQMDAGLDTGATLMLERFSMPPKITAPQLSDMLAIIGAKLIVKTLDQYDSLTPQPQSASEVTYANKLSKEESLINWSKSAAEIECMTRALNPWPGCFFVYKDEQIKILEAEIDSTNSTKSPGTVLNEKLEISCGSGILKPQRLQRPGKKPLVLSDFLRGFQIPAGTQL